jgi:hypothetical protein
VGSSRVGKPMKAINREAIEIGLFWAAVLVFGLLIWAYAIVGFWYVNQNWLHRVWVAID